MTTTANRNADRPALCRAGLFAFLLLATPAALVAAPVDIRADGDRLTLDANDAPVRDILSAIVGHCGLTVVSGTSLASRLTTRIEGQSLHELLARLLREQSYLLLQDTSTNRACGGTLWIFANAGENKGAFTLSGDAAEIARLRQQLGSENVREREAAIRDLRKLGTPAVTSPLAEAMSDADSRVRLKAIQALAHVAHDDVLAALSAGLTDENVRIRSAAANALGSLGNEAAIPMLEFALGDADSRVRETAIRAFVDIASPRSAEALSAAIRDPEPALRIEAIEALANFDNKTAVQHLEAALHHNDDEIREAAGEALGRRRGDQP